MTKDELEYELDSCITHIEIGYTESLSIKHLNRWSKKNIVDYMSGNFLKVIITHTKHIDDIDKLIDKRKNVLSLIKCNCSI